MSMHGLCGVIQRLACFVTGIRAVSNSTEGESLSRATFDAMPTLDVRQLSDKALTTAERVFNELKDQKMLPFNQMDEDPVRHELDRLLLSEVLRHHGGGKASGCA